MSQFLVLSLVVDEDVLEGDDSFTAYGNKIEMLGRC